MKNNILRIVVPTLALVISLAARADEKEAPAGNEPKPAAHRIVRIDRDDGPMEKVPVTFLGVETVPAGPTVTAQLGLPDDTGLVVTHVVGESPASAVLQRHDILTRLDDQILVDSRQLSVLVRSHKDGDEVALTILRGGKEQKLKVKLGKRDLPRLIGFDGGADGQNQFFRAFKDGEMPDLAELRELPGMAREDVDNVMRMIGREHGSWFATPQVHVFSHPGEKGSTIFNLADGNFTFSDETGSVEVTAGNGKRELTVKNAKGDVTFKGAINNAEDHQKLPPEVVARLEKIEHLDVSGEPGEDFEQDATAVSPPEKTKISLPPARREIGTPSQPFQPASRAVKF